MEYQTRKCENPHKQKSAGKTAYTDKKHGQAWGSKKKKECLTEGRHLESVTLTQGVLNKNKNERKGESVRMWGVKDSKTIMNIIIIIK